MCQCFVNTFKPVGGKGEVRLIPLLCKYARLAHNKKFKMHVLYIACVLM